MSTENFEECFKDFQDGQYGVVLSERATGKVLQDIGERYNGPLEDFRPLKFNSFDEAKDFVKNTLATTFDMTVSIHDCKGKFIDIFHNTEMENPGVSISVRRPWWKLW